MDYYDIHGGIMPDFFFVYSPEVGAFKSVFWNSHKERNNLNQMEMTGPLYERICGKDYNTISEPLVTIYYQTNLVQK